jgi:hypothetical protein
LICWVVQLSWQDVLLLALLPVVAAPVGSVPGTRHVVWQEAACELHAIMQLVTVEVATRNRVAACPLELQIATANPPQKTTRAIPPQCMTDSLGWESS